MLTGLVGTVNLEYRQMAEEVSEKPVPYKMVPLVWGDAGAAIYADNVLAQYDGKVVHLTFGQARPPMITGQTDEERESQLNEVKFVVVTPVAKLAMPAENFRAIVASLQQHIATIEKFDNQLKQ
jgi:hypothetical protein